MNTGLKRGTHAFSPLGLLAVTTYGPSSLATFTTSSATFADLDAVNLAVSFVAPASGKVIVQLAAGVSTPGSATYHQWGLRDANGDVPGTEMRVSGAFAAVSELGITREVFVSGLTPGMTYTWKWAHRRDAGTGTAPNTYAVRAGGPGPAVMKVFSA